MRIDPIFQMDFKNKVKINSHAPTQTETIDFHSAIHGYDNSFNLDDFEKNLKIEVISIDKDQIVFDLIGVDAPIANALRRIMIAEVPTMAIEKISVVNNTSIIQDENLCHRIGLIPIHVDPRYFVYKKPSLNPEEEIDLDQQTLLEHETLLFRLDVTCSKNPDERDLNPYINSVVKSGDIKWVPIGDQKKTLGNVKPVHDDIIIAKLRPGQTIHLECYAEKGIGKTHAKWSPVSTASYRLLPEIEITKNFNQRDAKKLVEKCPLKVFDIEDGEAVVKRPRDCTMCRECIREDGFEDSVKLSRVKDHFIFSVESVGIYTPEEIFKESLRIFFQKIKDVQKDINAKKEPKKRVFQ